MFSVWVITYLLTATVSSQSQSDINRWTATLKRPGDPCNPKAEAEFLAILQTWNDSHLEWAEADPKWNYVCNTFRYFRCDTPTKTCTCCNNDDGKVYWDAKGNKCRVKVKGHCLPDGSPAPVYGQPCFHSPIFKPLQNFTPDLAVPALFQCSGGRYESKLDKFTTHLLEFGNNDRVNDLLPKNSGLGKGSPCDIQEERNFHKALQNHANRTDFTWMKQFTKVCNVFKYLACDASSGKCICWHSDLFWAPNQILEKTTGSFDYGQFRGRCRVALKQQDSCSIDHPINSSVLSKYKKPFDLDIFDHIIDPKGTDYEILTLDPASIKCIPNSWNRMGHFECLPNAVCRTDLYFLTEEINLLRKNGGKDTNWSFPPNDLCDEVKQDEFLRDGQPYTWDFDTIRDIILKRETRDYCNPFIHQVCYKGICGCQRPIHQQDLTNGLKGDRYAYRNNECIPEEGITCSRRYWYNGNWVDFLDECDVSLKCVIAPDGLNHVCCNPEDLKENRIPIEAKKKARCRDQLLGYWEPASSVSALSRSTHFLLLSSFTSLRIVVIMLKIRV